MTSALVFLNIAYTWIDISFLVCERLLRSYNCCTSMILIIPGPDPDHEPYLMIKYTTYREGIVVGENVSVLIWCNM